MFNTKRIIFLIGLLSLVTLTGALLARPAFAGKPESSHKTLVCHWNSEVDGGLDGLVGGDYAGDDLPMGWYLDEVDDKSLRKHMKHGDIEIGSATAGDDGELGTEDDGVFTEGSCMDDPDFVADNRDDDRE